MECEAPERELHQVDTFWKDVGRSAAVEGYVFDWFWVWLTFFD